jgi:glucose/arabinose dehydrogenase
MISIVKRLAFAIATCFLLTGCSVDPLQTDVTPPVGSASGARALSPLPPDRFEGEPTRIGFEPIALQGGDFLQLMDFVFLPHTTDFLAVNRFGKVGYFRMESDVATMVDFFQIPAVHTEGDCGARSIALDPDFDANSIFYVAYCIDDQYDVVKRFEMSASDFSETVYSASNVAAVGDQKTDVSENAVGAMSFAKDGAMFVSVGDRHRGKYAQDFVNESGKIMRVVPLKQRRTSGFSVPAGNMPDTGPNGSKLLYAFGFSNPWRGSFDRLGRYWVADRGGASQEINVVTRVGENFGWPLADGRSCFALACSQTVQPIVSWDDSGDHRFILDDPLVRLPQEDRASWVGAEYVPDSYDRYARLLDNKMVYGDFYVGFVRGVALDVPGNIASDVHLGHLPLVVAWRQATDGYVYAGTMFDIQSDVDEQGKLWRVVPLP